MCSRGEQASGHEAVRWTVGPAVALCITVGLAGLPFTLPSLGTTSFQSQPRQIALWAVRTRIGSAGCVRAAIRRLFAKPLISGSEAIMPCTSRGRQTFCSAFFKSLHICRKSTGQSSKGPQVLGFQPVQAIRGFRPLRAKSYRHDPGWNSVAPGHSDPRRIRCYCSPA